MNINNELYVSNEEVDDYINVIMEHVKQLTNITEDVNKYTEKALDLNEKNRVKAHDAKVVMDNLMGLANDLVKN